MFLRCISSPWCLGRVTPATSRGWERAPFPLHPYRPLGMALAKRRLSDLGRSVAVAHVPVAA
eukprot:7120459-Alexandrium_andersonii.AAC.1